MKIPITREQYKERLKELEAEFNAKKQQLIIDVAESNNTYSVGDTITDHMGSIKISKVKYSLSYFENIPRCIYLGVELKKDGTPKKAATERWVYQENIITE